MPEVTGQDLVREWRELTDSMVAAFRSASGQAPLPRQIVEPMQRQLELVGELMDRERQLQAEVAERLLGPTDAAFDLLEQSRATMERQAAALEAAGDALRETATLMKSQAELLEQTLGTLRTPADVARSVLGAEGRKSRGRDAGGRQR